MIDSPVGIQRQRFFHLTRLSDVTKNVFISERRRIDPVFHWFRGFAIDLIHYGQDLHLVREKNTFCLLDSNSMNHLSNQTEDHKSYDDDTGDKDSLVVHTSLHMVRVRMVARRNQPEEPSGTAGGVSGSGSQGVVIVQHHVVSGGIQSHVGISGKIYGVGDICGI